MIRRKAITLKMNRVNIVCIFLLSLIPTVNYFIIALIFVTIIRFCNDDISWKEDSKFGNWWKN